MRCPRCDAASGAGCRAPSGKRLREPHAARRAAAHAAFLDALHPRPDPPWAAFAPFAEPELPTGSSERRRDPHDPLDDPRGDGRRLRHLARGLEEELPELSWYIEERWRMRHKPGVGFPRRCIPLHRGIWEIITTLRRHAEFARGADPLRHVDGDG